jgi:chromosome segregation ATPase
MIQINFDKFTQEGLKPVLQALKKHGLVVVNVEADNKPKRESGFQVKSATLEFESGQKLLIKAKAGGSIFQVKLNNKVIPIKHSDDMDKALLEVVAYIDANEANFKKQREKQLARQKVTEPLPKPVKASSAEMVEQLQARADEYQSMNEEVTGQIETLKTGIGAKEKQLADIKTEIDTEKARSDDLQKELEQLQAAV